MTKAGSAMGKIQSIAVGLAVFMTAALTTFAVDAKNPSGLLQNS
jgi:hypothetical protein